MNQNKQWVTLAYNNHMQPTLASLATADVKRYASKLANRYTRKLRNIVITKRPL